MHCPNCGKEVKDGQKFCGGCGAAISQLIQQQTSVSTPEQAEAPAIPEVPAAPVSESVQAAVSAAPETKPEQPKESAAPASAAQTAPTVVPPQKKSKLGLIIGLSAGGFVLVAGLVIGAVFAFKNMAPEPEPTRKTRVEADDDEPDDTKETTSSTTAETEPVSTVAVRTVMIYAIGTDLESKGGYLTQDIIEMLNADPSSEVNIVLQTGGCKQYQNDIMTGGITERFAILNGELYTLDDDSIMNASMIEPETLTDFISFAAENFPAEDYILVLWDHGGGVPVGFGYDELHDGTLTEIEMGNAIKNSGIEFETVVFDACLMGSIEVAKALDPYTEYIVAAEAPTWGYGINYTNFISFIGDGFTGTAEDYSEYIVKDYMAAIENAKSQGLVFDACMSAIDTDNVEELCSAYEAFIAALDNRVFGQNEFAEYVKLREECGAFSMTDSVDITTLAGKYINCGDQTLEQAASKLINEVSNCVFTESNNSYTYAHGMTAYAPYSYPEAYDAARNSFVSLGYSNTTILFYDKFVSAQLYYLNATSYAGSWYVQPSVDSSVKSGEHTNITDWIVDMGSYEAIGLTPESWDVIKSVEVEMYYIIPGEDNYVYYLGTDQQYSVDSNGYIKLQNPSKWVYFDGLGFVTCSCLEYEKYSDGSWYKLLGAEALVNGNEAYVVIGFSSEKPDGVILGYYLADILNDEYDSNQGYQLEESDSIIFVQEYYDVNTKKDDYFALGDAVSYSQAVSMFEYAEVDYGDVSVYLAFEILDAYNNTYYTDLRKGTSA